MMKELNEIPAKNPFKVPENYFENLTERIMSKTPAIETIPQKKSVVRILMPYLAAAASVTLLALIGYAVFYSGSNGQKRPPTGIAETGKYSTLYINDIDISTLEESVAENETAIQLPDVNKNEIIDYLISQDINILDIYEQL